MSGRVRPVTALVAAVVVLTTAGLVLVRPAGHRSSAARPAPARPPPSKERVTATATITPTTTTLPAAAVQLGARLDAALAGTNGCLSVEDANGEAVYQHQSDVPLAPASTQKLLVAATALSVLGANFRFVTNAVAPAAPVGGRVASLWLVGTGDPLLATPEFIASQSGRARLAGYPWTPLASIASALAAAGIRSVPGGIRGDDTYLDQLRFLSVWPAQYRQDQEIGLLSALSVNEGIQVTPLSQRLAPDPPGYVASEFARLVSQQHVVVAPSGGDAAAPASGVIVAHVESSPLAGIIDAMLRASDNWIAELLVRQIDKVSGGRGTTAGGLTIVMKTVASLGVPTAAARMDDGSGLSHSDRASCHELLAALDLGRLPGLEPLNAGLAVAAQSGTLAARYRRTPIAGRLTAKTGSVQNAGGMVGILSVGPSVRFALLVNQTMSDALLFAKEDQVVVTLASYGFLTPRPPRARLAAGRVVERQTQRA